MEFLIGRALGNALLNLGSRSRREALEPIRLRHWRSIERDGAGRRARQRRPRPARRLLPRLDGHARHPRLRLRHPLRVRHLPPAASWTARQVEMPDNWLRDGNPWEIARPERTYPVQFGGRVERCRASDGARRASTGWTPSDVLAMAYDTPIPGYGNGTVNTLRLWSAKATGEFDLDDFNRGDYIAAVEEKAQTREHLARCSTRRRHGYGQGAAAEAAVLLRLARRSRTSCARYSWSGRRFHDFPDKVAGPAQRHASRARHPRADAAADRRGGMELGRGVGASPGAPSRTPTTPSCPRRWRRWPVELFERVLPRHLQIIYEIDRRFPGEVRAAFPVTPARVERMAIVAGGQVRMANLAIVGQPHGQRRVGAPHAAPRGAHLPRLRRALAGEVRQHHQRRDAAPLAPEGQPGAVGADHAHHRRRLDHRPPSARGLEPCADDDGVPRGLARGQGAPTRQRAGASRAARAGVEVDPRPCSTCR